mgnify:CR=1 FL=1
MTEPALRLAFPKGCRVRLTAMGKLVARHKREDRVGTVTGHSRPDQYSVGECIYVRWDGLTTPVSWHRDYVERVDPDA